MNFWKYLGHDPKQGFASVRLSWEDEAPPPEEIVNHPDFHQVVDLSIQGWALDDDRQSDYTAWFEALRETATNLEVLNFDSLSSGTAPLHDQGGSLSDLFEGQPQLEQFDCTCTVTVSQRFVAPKLRSVRLQGALTRATVETVLQSSLPAVENLVLFSDVAKVSESAVVDFFQRRDLLALRRLLLPTLDAAPELFAKVAASPLVGQLHDLSLVHAEVPDDEPFIAALLEQLGAFTHLKRLCVSQDFLDQSVTDRFPSIVGAYAR